MVFVGPGGSSWDQSSVLTVLLNENYLGDRVWNQTRRDKKKRRGTKIQKPREEWVISKNAHPAIISDDLWKKAQRRRGEFQVPIGAGAAGGNNVEQSPYLLTGLMKCAECGASYIMSKRTVGERVYRYYRCSWHSNRGEAVCSNKRMVLQKRVEDAVLDVISQELLTPESIDDIVEESRAYGRETSQETAERLKMVRGSLGQVEKEIGHMIEAIKVIGPMEEFKREIPSLLSRKARLEEELRTTEAQAQIVSMEGLDAAFVVEVITKLKDKIHRVTTEERKVLLREFVAEIRVPAIGEALLWSIQ